jgi:hypothetical protein
LTIQPQCDIIIIEKRKKGSTKMKHIELTEKIPSTMTMNVNAVYNEEKECWEVVILEVGTAKAVITNEPLYYQRETSIEICDECDEFVIPIAILEHNGINTHKLFFTEE